MLPNAILPLRVVVEDPTVRHPLRLARIPHTPEASRSAACRCSTRRASPARPRGRVAAGPGRCRPSCGANARCSTSSSARCRWPRSPRRRLAAVEGDVVTIRVRADDYDDVTPDKEPGRQQRGRDPHRQPGRPGAGAATASRPDPAGPAGDPPAAARRRPQGQRGREPRRPDDEADPRRPGRAGPRRAGAAADPRAPRGARPGVPQGPRRAHAGDAASRTT